jgi:hypothetical protein
MVCHCLYSLYCLEGLEPETGKFLRTMGILRTSASKLINAYISETL